MYLVFFSFFHSSASSTECEGMLFKTAVFLLLISTINGITSPIEPYTIYNYSVELEANVADLFWSTNEETQEILFEFHVNTTGWIALGISPCKYSVS